MHCKSCRPENDFHKMHCKSCRPAVHLVLGGFHFPQFPDKIKVRWKGGAA